jgi:hypothetical protein
MNYLETTQDSTMASFRKFYSKNWCNLWAF